jgi:glyoxylase-like metal-dependent hydrolase (beta-lactamase superfamily II)/rhodanese-related sulfurtransferase
MSDVTSVSLPGGHPYAATLLGDGEGGPDLRAVAVTDQGLGNTSWVVDLGTGEALVVDPERDPEPYRHVAERLGTEVALAAETHLHADFVTGSRELAATGTRVVAAAAGDIAWPHAGLREGDDVDLGRWRLRALATPGHTPEHLAYLLADTRDGDRPRAVFTGGSLLVGAVARTDLIDPADTEALTRALWRSIHHELLTLPDDVAVFPTHGAGSFCSAAGGAQRWTTIGAERRANPLLAAPDEDAFVRQLLDSLGTYPPYFLRLRDLNRQGPAVLGPPGGLPLLGADEVAALREKGAVVVDVRPVADFAVGHVPGSLANTLRPQFASWLGWLVPDPATPLVFVAGHHQDRRDIVRQCHNIGYENLAGELDGGIDIWRAAGGDLATLTLVEPTGIDGRTVLDVRQDNEHRDGHLPGAVHIELGALPGRNRELPTEPLVVMCGHGERAATAASLLEAAGHRDLAVMTGGPGDWAEATGHRLTGS